MKDKRKLLCELVSLLVILGLTMPLSSIPVSAQPSILVDGNPDDWSSLEPTIVDPQGDSICGADADIKRVYTAMDDSYAYVMVETYGVPIHEDAVIEINFDYKPGKHFIHGSECCDDLTTNIPDCTLHAWNDNDLDGIMESYPITGYVCARGDVMELAIPLSEIENAEYFNATFVNIFDYSYEMGNWGCDPAEPPIKCRSTATGTGTACFSFDYGTVEYLFVLPAIPPGAPAGIVFPHGMFLFNITGLNAGQNVTVTVTLPDPVPLGTKWWKCQNGSWYSLDIGDDDGDNTITVMLTDNGLGDANPASGNITDPGGPGNPGAVGWEPYPVNKVRVLLPWIALFTAIMVGAGLLWLRHRRTQS